MAHIKVQKEIAGRMMTLETGKIAKQAHGAVMVTYGDTVVLVTVLTAPPTREIDFFPLYVDYREATYAAGKIPGGFFKREGRPSEKEILTMRMIDRPIRPLFPHDFRNEVQIQCMVLSSDGQNDPDLLAMIGASAALTISPAPFDGPIGCSKVAYVDGKYILNPTHDDLEISEMDMVVAGPKGILNMIEMAGQQVSEEVTAEALRLSVECYDQSIELIEELASQCEIVQTYEPTEIPAELKKIAADKCSDEVRTQKLTPGKADRYEAMKEIRQRLIDELIPEGSDPEELPYTLAQITEVFYKLEGKIQRELILDGKRMDGRGNEDCRALGFETGVLPRTHGSAIFSRGETQALVTATLGTPRDQPIIDGLTSEYKKKFFMHYNFPPFSVGQIKPLRGPSRRDTGHGALAEKSLAPVLPSEGDDFPYTVRLVAELMESNGSTSQAATTGGTMALLNAGVPIKAPVAGISIGMVSEGDKYVLLTDIVGEEDFHGDMDFKVAGTPNGITGIQLDMKARGIRQDQIVETLAQAKRARLDILSQMAECISAPSELSEFAPRMLQLKINPEKIGKVIGPGGKMINKIQDETEASIDIDEDGTIYFAAKGEGAEKAREWVRAIVEDAEVGRIYKGTVVSTRDFGAFVEILPGTEGLCHVSELADGFVENVEDQVKVGDEIQVRVIGIDDSGKVKVSRKAAQNEEWTPEAQAQAGERRGGGGRGGDRGGRGGDRRGGGGGRGGRR